METTRSYEKELCQDLRQSSRDIFVAKHNGVER
jgi:hypothetical protein